MKSTKFILLLGVLLVAFGSCQEREIKEEKEIIIEKEIDPDMEPGLIHNVYFWLKDDITEEETKRFLIGLRSLESVETVERMFLGRPANTLNRDVVDNSFDYSLQLWFKDQAGQDTYQAHPTHLEFVELQGLWTKVVVRDNVGL